MSRLQDLIQKIEDPVLRERIEQEIKKLAERKKFGLVFEEHLPECTPLYDVPIRVGSKVALKTGYVDKVYLVENIDGSEVRCIDQKTQESWILAIEDLVSIAEFGEPIYPALEMIDSIENAPDDGTWNTLIEAENYHALQLLEYLYPGQVDCIYIDPPYNTGAKDWKYNNAYVDSTDSYRHSKWLSMMEKRLTLAKKILNPRDSVLIVTIDEKEYMRLGCLLEDLFPESRIQMITSVISAKGVVRTGQFSRVEEYIYIVQLGMSKVNNGAYNMLDNEVKKKANRQVEWLGFRRRAPQAKRGTRPNQFYPIFVDTQHGVIHSIGDPVRDGIDRHSITVPNGCIALWPLSSNGDERLWSLVPQQARKNLDSGYLKVKWNKTRHTGTVYYLPAGTIRDIESNVALVSGRDADGSVIAEYADDGTTPPKRVWNMASHNAETYGSKVVSALVGRRFDYPKSVYAVEDTLRFFVKDKDKALIVDFFAGSGTTLHAVNLLNAEDGGHRRCIMVTNNEVSVNEADALTSNGVRPGDDKWEQQGVARYVTWPRTVCSIEGRDVSGEPLSGKYLGSDRPMADGFAANAAFFKLVFLDKTSVALGRQFRNLLPVFWLKAGAYGECPSLDNDELPSMIVLPKNKMALLLDEAHYSEFSCLLADRTEIETIYFVTDSEDAYKRMMQPYADKACYQLYRDYLDNFRINIGR